jgi:hypothetical protein
VIDQRVDVDAVTPLSVTFSADAQYLPPWSLSVITSGTKRRMGTERPMSGHITMMNGSDNMEDMLYNSSYRT